MKKFESVIRYFASCRIGSNIRVPCNWVHKSSGRCGADSLKCVFEDLVERKVREEVEEK